MPLPNINLSFQTTGQTAVSRGERGIVAMILKDSVSNGLTEIYSSADIPSGLSTANKEQINFALVGGVKPPLKVVIYVIPTASADYTTATPVLETVKFDYLVCPTDISASLKTAITTWVANCRNNLGKKIKAVLPNSASDNEGIINFNTDSIKIGANTYNANQFCSRIAGLLAGTPLTMSATFQTLPEVSDVPRLTKSALDTAIDGGEFRLYYDGERVKVARAVNSLVTTTATKGASFKKIKIVDIVDLIHDDIKRTTENNFVGKFSNTYDNKCILISAINSYYTKLENDGILNPTSDNICKIDLVAQKNYLQSQGVAVGSLSDQQIKEYDTADKVYLASTIKPSDAIEDITMSISI